jgi:hypothetical protein
VLRVSASRHGDHSKNSMQTRVLMHMHVDSHVLRIHSSIRGCQLQDLHTPQVQHNLGPN